MIHLKSHRDLLAMRPACRVAALVLMEIGDLIRPGLTTKDIDLFAAERIETHGGKSAFLGYRKFPGHVCISVNDEVVHGIGKNRILLFGDIVSVDCGVYLNGFVGDTARTYIVGGCGPSVQSLLDVTERALTEGIRQAVVGNRVVDISRAIQSLVESNGYSVVREFVGHGVGRSVHEDPQVPNFVEGGRSEKLRAGMTIAIEPMVNAGAASVKILKDGWTVVTRDGSLSAHFEHTVLITEGEPEIMTVAGNVAVGSRPS
jgi:methionyl aminopeptidase